MKSATRHKKEIQRILSIPGLIGELKLWNNWVDKWFVVEIDPCINTTDFNDSFAMLRRGSKSYHVKFQRDYLEIWNSDNFGKYEQRIPYANIRVVWCIYNGNHIDSKLKMSDPFFPDMEIDSGLQALENQIMNEGANSTFLKNI